MQAELRSRLKDQQALTEGILDRIATQRNLFKAFQNVKRNHGSAGVDNVSIADYEKELNSNIQRLTVNLLDGSYRPEAVRVVEIPKPNGGKRQLGIPTVEDRIVQQSILQELQRVYEPYFSEYSYGFRPGRSTHDAVQQAAQYVSQGKIWVVNIDLKSFFDVISHDRLISRLSKAIADNRLILLIRRILKADLFKGGLASQRIAGTPQGGPLSPLLSNIVLDELDRELTLRGLCFARYADDCNVFVGSQRAAERVLASLTRFIEDKLKLKVNRDKSGVRQCNRVAFLGYTIEQNGKIRIADKSLKRFRKRIIELTKRNRGMAFQSIVAQVNKLIKGWAVYYRLCNTWLGILRNLDGWIRRRLRCYRLKLCGRSYPAFRLLRSLGVPKSKAWNAVIYRSWWAMSNYPPVSKALGLRFFRDTGLLSLVESHMVRN